MRHRVRARRRRVAKCQCAGIDEKAAITILGKAGQAVDVRDRDAGPLQRLDQRIGQPLRKLVQRDELAGRVRLGSDGWRQQSPSGTPPSVSRDGQIGPKCWSKLREDRRRPRVPLSRQCGEMIEQAARARTVVAPKNIRLGGDERTETAQQVDAAIHADERIGIGHLQAVADGASERR